MRLTYQAICAIYLSYLKYRNKDSNLFLANSPLTYETESVTLKHICIKAPGVFLGQCHWCVAVKSQEMFNKWYQRAVYTFQLQSFISDVNTLVYKKWKSGCARPPLLKACIGSDLIVHERIHHPWEGQQSQRHSPRYGKIQPAMTWVHCHLCDSIWV